MPRYAVSSDGRVFRFTLKDGLEQMLEMKTRINDEGYVKLKLQVGEGAERKRREFFVHRLVLFLFRGPPPAGKPYGCHRDGDRRHNGIGNLYWGSHQDNHADKVAAGTHARGAVRKTTKDLVRKIRRSKIGAARLAKKLGLSISHVREIRNGRRCLSK